LKCADGIHQDTWGTYVGCDSIDQGRYDIGICDVSDLAPDVIGQLLEIRQTPIDRDNRRAFSGKHQSRGVAKLSPGSGHDCDGTAHVKISLPPQFIIRPRTCVRKQYCDKFGGVEETVEISRGIQV
jgi:hypothetical protein